MEKRFFIFDRKIDLPNCKTRQTKDGKHVIEDYVYEAYAKLLNGIKPIGSIENPDFVEEEMI